MNTQDIVDRLDILITLMTPKFDPTKYPYKGVALDILMLSDGDNTRDDMVKKTKKPKTVIDPILSKLRGQGLIKSISKDSKTFYIRLL